MIVGSADGLGAHLAEQSSVRDLLAEEMRIVDRARRKAGRDRNSDSIPSRRNHKLAISNGVLYAGVERRAQRRKVANCEREGTSSSLSPSASQPLLGESAVESAINIGACAKDMSVGRMYEYVAFIASSTFPDDN